MTAIPMRPGLAGGSWTIWADAWPADISRATGRSRGAASSSSSDLGVSKALLTTSCTHALEMAALLLDVGPATR